jgi:hypothetical protein
MLKICGYHTAISILACSLVISLMIMFTPMETLAQCDTNPPTLESGASGNEVKVLQQLLQNSGHDPGSIDGKFGPNTRNAVIEFQEANGLVVDGKVGPKTWNVLCTFTSTGPTTSGPTTSGPTTSGPTTSGPTTSGPTTSGPPTPVPPTPVPPTPVPPTPVPPTAPSAGQPSITGYVKCTPPDTNNPDSLKAFINNPEASTLDFLPKDKCLLYRNLQWDPYDYYGGKEGPNEKKVPAMIAGLKKVNPERRATVEEGGVPAGTAVLCVKCYRADPHIVIEKQGDSEKRTITTGPTGLWSWIQDQLIPVSGTGTGPVKQLNKYAAEKFLEMKKAADDYLGDGIKLEINTNPGNAFRSKTAADTNCARVGNNFAVACFPNSHNLGLAVDLKMSYPGHRYHETSTEMQNVVDMRQSPVHKWLFLNAAKFGFYPYTHEPWHWEYNPPNFANTFFAGAPR